MVKDMFDMNRWWMLGAQNNRWLFVAIELTILAHQFDAFKKGRSTWNIKKTGVGMNSPLPQIISFLAF